MGYVASESNFIVWCFLEIIWGSSIIYVELWIYFYHNGCGKPLSSSTGKNRRKWFWLTCILNLVKHGSIALERPCEGLQKFWKMNLTWYVGSFMWIAGNIVWCLIFKCCVQEMNAGFENEFFLLKSVLRYGIPRSSAIFFAVSIFATIIKCNLQSGAGKGKKNGCQ